MSAANTENDSAWEEARDALGVAANATDAELRAAYVEKVRQHPPDRDPDVFERIRDAYDRLRDPRVRAKRVLAAPQPDGPLTDLLEGADLARRRFVGPQPWLELLREKRP
jgi:hypothetical protein